MLRERKPLYPQPFHLRFFSALYSTYDSSSSLVLSDPPSNSAILAQLVLYIATSSLVFSLLYLTLYYIRLRISIDHLPRI